MLHARHIHIHFGSRSQTADDFAKSDKKYSTKKGGNQEYHDTRAKMHAAMPTENEAGHRKCALCHQGAGGALAKAKTAKNAEEHDFHMDTANAHADKAKEHEDQMLKDDPYAKERTEAHSAIGSMHGSAADPKTKPNVRARELADEGKHRQFIEAHPHPFAGMPLPGGGKVEGAPAKKTKDSAVCGCK